MSRLREQLASLHAVSVEIAPLRSLAAICDVVLARSVALTGSERGFVGLLDEQGGRFDIAASHGYGGHERLRKGQSVPLRGGPLTALIRQGRPLLGNELDGEVPGSAQPPAEIAGPALLAVPLEVGREVSGLIGVADRPGGYGEDDLQLLLTLSRQVVVPIESTRMRERRREPPAPARSPASPGPLLSPSQAAILPLLVEGLSNAEIAARVHLSENTVKTHMREILRRAGARNRVEVAVRAVREGWVG